MTTSSTTDQPAGNLDWDTLTLARGSHSNGETDGCGNPLLCFMEAFNASRGLGVTDTCPADVSLTLHGFIINLNDTLGTTDRQPLKPYRDRIIGTGGQPDADERAAYMCVDWLIRTYTPAFLRLAGLTAHADAFAGAGEIIDLATLDQVNDRISAAQSAAYAAARSAAYAAAGSAAYAAAGSAAYAAAVSAAVSVADSAAVSAAVSAAYLAARSMADSAVDSAVDSAALQVARAAVDSVARSVAVSAADSTVSAEDSAAVSAAVSAAAQELAPTVAALQASAFDLLDRMIATYTVAAA